MGKGGRLAAGGVGAVAGGVGNVGKGVFSGVRGVVPLGRRNTGSTMGDGDGFAVPDGNSGSGGAGQPLAVPSHSQASDINGRINFQPVGGGTPDFGLLHITVTDIQGVPQDEKVHVQLHHGSKHHEKAHVAKNPSTGHNDIIFTVKTLPESMILTLSLVIKKAFGKDRTLGSAEFDVWSLIHPGTQTSNQTMLTTGAGDIALSLNWTPAGGNTGTSSNNLTKTNTSQAANADHLNAPDSPASAKSRSRFTMHRKRETTPSS